jgi:very-short-patch-repair endonuclease
VRSGDVVRDARGRYALPAAEVAVRAAGALSGVVSHLSAAQLLGWETKTTPARPHVTVPRNRRLDAERRRRIVAHWADLEPAEVRDLVTSPARTLTDCLVTLPFDEALSVADSALRHSAFTNAELERLVASLSGPGSARARRVGQLADGRAANPFESVLRAIALEVRGLSVVPQQNISWPGFHARPDLVDESHDLVLEADSHTWHSSRTALRRDCRRYNALVLHGWTVLRFTWEDVMLRPGNVHDDLELFVKHAQRRIRSRRRA